MTETMTIPAACKAIGYTPAEGFEDKTDAVQWGMIRAKRIEYAKRDACVVLGTFAADKLFGKLPENVQAAITTLTIKRTGGGGGGSRANVFMDNLRGFLVDVGDGVTELDMFKATKMGRGEIRAKIRENLKKADLAERFWVELDSTTEHWVLLGIGEAQPEGWKGTALDVPEADAAE